MSKTDKLVQVWSSETARKRFKRIALEKDLSLQEVLEQASNQLDKLTFEKVGTVNEEGISK